MVDVLMHIGLGKSGSSALQTILSQNPSLRLNNNQYNKVEYVSFDHHGNVYSGKELHNKAKNRPQKYIHCEDVHQSWEDHVYKTIKDQLNLISENGKNLLVFSNEGWSHQAEYFLKYDIFNKIGVKVKAICYIRNPVELINSAWWQWGAWDFNTLDDFLNFAMPHIGEFSKELAKWKNLIGTENLTIKVLPTDIVSDFLDYLDVKEVLNSTSRNNTSLPEEFLRFYQTHRDLRPSAHASTMDFIIEDVFNLDDTYSKTPWVLKKEHIEKMIEVSRESNMQLLTLVDKTTKEQILSDLKWWDANAFSYKIPAEAVCDNTYITYEKMDDMLFQSLLVIKKLYMENLKLKTKIAE